MRLALALLLWCFAGLALAHNLKPYPGSLDCEDTTIAFDFSSAQPAANATIGGSSYRQASSRAYIEEFLGGGSPASELFAPSGASSVLCTVTPAHWCDGSECYVAPWYLRLAGVSGALASPLSNERVRVYVEWAGGGGQSRTMTLMPLRGGMTLAGGNGACLHRGRDQKDIKGAQVRIYFALELRQADALARNYAGAIQPNYELVNDYFNPNPASFPCS